MATNTEFGAALYAMAGQDVANRNAAAAGYSAIAAQNRADEQTHKANRLIGELGVEKAAAAGLHEVLLISRARSATYERMMVGMLKKMNEANLCGGEFNDAKNADILNFIQQSANRVFPYVVVLPDVIKGTFIEGTVFSSDLITHTTIPLDQVTEKYTNTDWIGNAKYPALCGSRAEFKKPDAPQADPKILQEKAEFTEFLKAQLTKAGYEHAVNHPDFPDLARGDRFDPLDLTVAIPALSNKLLQVRNGIAEGKLKELKDKITALQAESDRLSKGSFFSKIFNGNGSEERKELQKVELEHKAISDAARLDNERGTGVNDPNLKALVADVVTFNKKLDPALSQYDAEVAAYNELRRKEKAFADECVEYFQDSDFVQAYASGKPQFKEDEKLSENKIIATAEA
jgi:hypothetical protein